MDTPTNKVMDFVSTYCDTQKNMKEKADKLVEKFLKNYKHEEVIEIVFTDPDLDDTSDLEDEEKILVKEDKDEASSPVQRIATIAALKEQKSENTNSNRA